MPPLGQLYLPPLDLCTGAFLGKLLRGEKRAFFRHETKPIKLPQHSTFYVKHLVKLAQAHETAMLYLPDEPIKHVTKEFIGNVLNTLDDTFFPRAIAEIQERQKAKQVVKKEAIHITPEMAALMARLSVAGVKKWKPNKRSLSCLKLGTRKRTRQAKQLEEAVTAKLDGKVVEVCATG